ncbi:hypothetical protein GDO86_014251 [Hymenochirus boettgeri]|uniref:IF rod domain-containing protein n=1 Tax=Hymenochirus boettgeri TaxID=247094 RepID=A0A8T2JSA3_9PIPI|nr:hypothetical protein GDO86_014251 [Hymenochirus boettgeri]
MVNMDFGMERTVLSNADFPISDPKTTMKELNGRLADFMKHCYDLEESNNMLQKKIEEKVKENPSSFPGWQRKEKESNDLLDSIKKIIKENTEISLEIDNNLMDLTLLKKKLHHEQSNNKQILWKNKLLETIRDEFKLSIKETEFVMKEKKTEINDVMLSHQEAVQAVQQLIQPIDEIQFATVEDGSSMELSQLLNEIRTYYESLISSSQIPNDLSTSTQIEEEEVRKKMEKDEEELREARANLTEARRQFKNLQTEIDSLQALERSLKYTLHTTKHQHQKQLENLSAVIVDLEQELREVRQGVRTQLEKHKMLLNTNMKLEQEISAYRTLLEREEKRLLKEEKPSTSRIVFTVPQYCNTGDSEVDTEQEASQNQSDTCIEESGSWFSEDDESSSVDKTAEADHEAKTNWPVFNGNIEEGAEAIGTIPTEKVDKVIKEWEGSFFKDNPRLRKKSVSLRFDLHLAAANETMTHTKVNSLPDIEVRLKMRRSCSNPSMSP